MNRRKFIQKVGLFGVIAIIGKSFFAKPDCFDVQKFAIDQAKRSTHKGKEFIIYIDGKPIGKTKSLTIETEINYDTL